MGLYVYCLVPAGHAPPQGLHGLDARAVELLPLDSLAAWISRMDRPQADVERLKEHNAVIEAAVTDAITPVPLRFGQWLESEAALRDVLNERSAQYHRMLTQFAGCLEFGLRFLDPAPAPPARDVHTAPPASGREYMQALVAETKRAQQKKSLAAQVHARVQDVLGRLVRAEKEEKADTAHAVLSLSHLVAHSDFDEYRDRARALRNEFNALRLLVSGPWPPYSFAV